MQRSITTIAILGFLSIASTAQAELTLDEFLSKMSDPESPSVSQPTRDKAASVASMGHGEGTFSVMLPSGFMDRRVSQSNSSNIRMGDAINIVYGNTRFWGKGPAPYQWYWTITPSQDETLSILTTLGAFTKDAIQWRAEKDEKDLPDGRDLPGNGHCTGFLVGSNLLMTNHHCIASEAKCGIIAFRFNEELDHELKNIKVLDVYKCKQLIFTDSELDLSLVEVEGTPAQKYAPLSLTDRVPVYPHSAETGWKLFPYPHKEYKQVEGESLTIIGHPGSHPAYLQGDSFRTIKKISATCHVTGPISSNSYGIDPYGELLRFHYSLEKLFDATSPTLQLEPVRAIEFSTDCYVAGGNSGSPVFDANLDVVGIAHRGEWGKTNVVPMSEIFRRHGDRLKQLGIFPER